MACVLRFVGRWLFASGTSRRCSVPSALLDGGDDLDLDGRRRLEQEVSACDSLQKAAKELCNSLFGVFGCPGVLYNPMVADVIPKLGAMLNMLYTLETTERDWRSSVSV